MSKEDLEKKQLELQALSSHIKNIQQQIISLEQQHIELNKLEEDLKDIKNFSNVEMFVNLGSGVFVKGKLEKTNKVLMNVGSNIVINKDIEASREIIVKQASEIRNVIEELGKRLKIGIGHFETLQKDLEDS